MSIKEKPLLDAVEKLGPLPGFFFSHSVFAGFFCILMCAIFGAVIMLFQTAGRGEVYPLHLFDYMRTGAIIVVAIAGLIFIWIAIMAFREPDETRPRLLFVLGGSLGAAMLIGADYFFTDMLRAWLANAGPIV